MIYPLDIICKNKTDFSSIKNLYELKEIIENISHPYEYLNSLDEKSILFEPSKIKEFVTFENQEVIYKKISADTIYKTLLFDISKTDNKIDIQTKIIYILKECIDDFNIEPLKIKIGNFIVLEIKTIELSDLLK